MPIQEAVWEARSQWRDTGQLLGLKPEDIEAINEPNDEQCLHKVLLHWIRSGRATTSLLLDALCSELVNRPGITRKMNSLKGVAREAVGLVEMSEQLNKAVRQGNLEKVKLILRDNEMLVDGTVMQLCGVGP